MLQKMKNLDFRYIWPGNWKDIGFTERPIYLNGKGYGYIYEEEPCDNWKLESFSNEKWQVIRKKLQSGKLVLDDLSGTALEGEEDIWDMLSETDDVCDLLSGLMRLPEELDEHIYCVSSFDGYDFFATYEDFKEAVERNDCDYKWEDLSDDVLEMWVERLANGSLNGFLFRK